MKKIKPGYKILFIIALLYTAYYLYSKNQEHKIVYINAVEKIVTDIRREDYFAIQEHFNSKLAKSVSIENIKEFASNLDITKNSKFYLDTIKTKSDTLIDVDGVVATKSKELPLDITFRDSNGTLYIEYIKIGTKELNEIKYDFPIVPTKK